jgi:hypothetical protein
LPFVTAVRSVLLGRGVTADRTRHEIFGPGAELAA